MGVFVATSEDFIDPLPNIYACNPNRARDVPLDIKSWLKSKVIITKDIGSIGYTKTGYAKNTKNEANKKSISKSK